MSNIDPTLSHEAIIPSFTSEIFRDNPDAQFATGLVGYGLSAYPGRDDVFDAYLRLRANVYIDKAKMLSPDARLENGGELDSDDARSAHFAVVENMGDYQRVVASMRVIHGGEMGKLPIEEFFPEIPFSTNHTGSAIEISRYICQHEDPKTQDGLKWKLYPAALAYIMRNGLGPTYAVVEPFLEAQFKDKRVNIPVDRVAEPKFVPEYNDVNLGIIIHTDQLTKNMEARNPGSVTGIDLSTMKFAGSRQAAMAIATA